MELLASNVPQTVSPLSYIMYYPDSGLKGRRDGAGSTEATEMILNNLFYITAKVCLNYFFFHFHKFTYTLDVYWGCIQLIIKGRS